MQYPGETIRLFNRFELKYILTLQEAENLKVGLLPYMLPDCHGNSDGRYSLTSLYYDSPNLRCYHEKVDGLRVRRKLRIRRYESGDLLMEDSPVFLEIKQRVDRVTQKRRALLSYGNALRLCNDREIPEHDPQDDYFLNEVYAFLWQYNLQPASILRYTRQAFIGTEYDPGLRVTFDTSLSFQTGPLYLHEQSANLPMFPANKVVVEIKVNERIPQWIIDLIRKNNLELVRMSKYCQSIEAAQAIGSMRMMPARRESAHDVLSSTISTFASLQYQMGMKH